MYFEIRYFLTIPNYTIRENIWGGVGGGGEERTPTVVAATVTVTRRKTINKRRLQTNPCDWRCCKNFVTYIPGGAASPPQYSTDQQLYSVQRCWRVTGFSTLAVGTDRATFTHVNSYTEYAYHAWERQYVSR